MTDCRERERERERERDYMVYKDKLYSNVRINNSHLIILWFICLGVTDRIGNGVQYFMQIDFDLCRLLLLEVLYDRFTHILVDGVSYIPRLCKYIREVI